MAKHKVSSLSLAYSPPPVSSMSDRDLLMLYKQLSKKLVEWEKDNIAPSATAEASRTVASLLAEIKKRKLTVSSLSLSHKRQLAELRFGRQPLKLALFAGFGVGSRFNIPAVKGETYTVEKILDDGTVVVRSSKMNAMTVFSKAQLSKWNVTRVG